MSEPEDRLRNELGRRAAALDVSGEEALPPVVAARARRRRRRRAGALAGAFAVAFGSLAVVTPALLDDAPQDVRTTPGSDEDERQPTTTQEPTTTTRTETAPPSTTPLTTTAPPPATPSCVSDQAAPPPDASTASVPDLDGDGQDDTAYLAGGPGDRRFGVRGTTGLGAEFDAGTASPVPGEALVADADGDGRPEILVSDGRSVDLLVLDGCDLVPVTNPEGEPYTFDLGFLLTGTGIGCVGGELVGLNVTSRTDTEVRWTRTAVRLDGTRARNGRTVEGTFTLPEDAAAAELLRDITCREVRPQLVEADG